MERSPGKLEGSETIKEGENDSAGSKGESQHPPRVTFNAAEITVVRRPGEGSRPLFDRDEIINHERMHDREGRRLDRHSFSQSDTDTAERRRAYDSLRTRCSRRVRSRRERCCSRYRRRCRNCLRYSTCVSDDEEIHAIYHGDRLYRTRSDEIMLLDHPYLYQEPYPSEYYYHFGDAGYYEVVGDLVLPPTFSYSYFADF